RAAAGQRLVALDVETGALEDGLEHVDRARLVPRGGRAVVDAGVADQRLEQLDGLSGQRRVGHDVTLRAAPPTASRRSRRRPGTTGGSTTGRVRRCARRVGRVNGLVIRLVCAYTRLVLLALYVLAALAAAAAAVARAP